MKRTSQTSEALDYLTRETHLPTLENLSKRAREIALIEGHEVNDEYLERAVWEMLKGESMPEHTLGDEEDEETLSRNPAEPVLDRGEAAPKIDAVDSQELEVQEVNRGLLDALHEQMLLCKTSKNR